MPLKGGRVIFRGLGWISAVVCLNSGFGNKLEGFDFSASVMRVANMALVCLYCAVNFFMIISM